MCNSLSISRLYLVLSPVPDATTAHRLLIQSATLHFIVNPLVNLICLLVSPSTVHAKDFQARKVTGKVRET